MNIVTFVSAQGALLVPYTYVSLLFVNM